MNTNPIVRSAPATHATAPPHRPRWTIRLRLTVVYGALFLLSGTALLAITYALVDQDDRDDSVTIITPDGSIVNVSGTDGAISPTELPLAEGAGDGFIPASAETVRELTAQRHNERMQSLLTRSATALGIMTVVSAALGWVVAGRVLRPLRTITATTRTITATNLHQRLALGGPRDELTDLAGTIDDLLTRLDAAFEAQRRFVANASHELRTPLARQRTVAQVALDDPDATVESLRAAHATVLAAGHQQERLIDALLMLARGQAGLLEAEPVALATLAQRAIQARTDAIDTRRLDVQADLQPAWVDGDPHLLERVVSNLVDNAIRHNHACGSIRVATGTRHCDRFVSVANTGPAVDAAAVEQLYQPFRRLDPHRNPRGDGVGLGLSIVKAIADVHGASIHTQPNPAGGLTVEISFPDPAVIDRAAGAPTKPA